MKSTTEDPFLPSVSRSSTSEGDDRPAHDPDETLRGWTLVPDPVSLDLPTKTDGPTGQDTQSRIEGRKFSTVTWVGSDP